MSTSANPELETLMARANAAAETGDWAACYTHLLAVAALAPADEGVQSALGMCQVSLGQLAQAVTHFERAAELAPMHATLQMQLGTARLAQGDSRGAESAFRLAVQLDPADLSAQRSLAISLLQQDRAAEGMNVLVATLRANPSDAETLYLLGQCYEQGDDPASARYMYEQALIQAPEHAGVQAALARLPAPEAANPTRIARPEHAKKLAGLKGLRKSDQPAPTSLWSPVLALCEGAARVALFAPPAMLGQIRMQNLAALLTAQGKTVQLAEKVEPQDLANFDLCVFAQPNLSGDLILGVQACLEAGKPYGVDMDLDYHALPAAHPAYSQFGAGNPRALQALEVVLGEAAWVTTSSEGLKARYAGYNPRVEVFWPAWNRAEPLWERPAAPHSELRVGWIGSTAERGDFLALKRELVRFLRAVPEAVLLITGDMEAFTAFGSISEKQRQFLPSLGGEDTPYLLAQMDVVIIPAGDAPFYQVRSDQAVLEAGVRRVPWLAADLPAYRAWGVGGFVVEQPQDWHRLLERLARDRALRIELGAAGRQQADLRRLG